MRSKIAMARWLAPTLTLLAVGCGGQIQEGEPDAAVDSAVVYCNERDAQVSEPNPPPPDLGSEGTFPCRAGEVCTLAFDGFFRCSQL